MAESNQNLAQVLGEKGCTPQEKRPHIYIKVKSYNTFPLTNIHVLRKGWGKAITNTV
jgi:hypothetical protein